MAEHYAGTSCLLWKANNVGGRGQDRAQFLAKYPAWWGFCSFQAPNLSPHCVGLSPAADRGSSTCCRIYESSRESGANELMNRFTVPAMLRADISVLDPSALTLRNKDAVDVVHHTELTSATCHLLPCQPPPSCVAARLYHCGLLCPDSLLPDALFVWRC